MPRRYVPKEIKELQGTAQPCRVRESKETSVQKLSDLPEPPEWLRNKYALQEYKRLGEVLINNKLLTVVNISVFQLLCALHGQIINSLEGDEKVDTKLVTQYRNLVNDFGLSPVNAHKLGSAKATELEQNPFSALTRVK